MAIDLTASNGLPEHKSSLHSKDWDENRNQYLQAIRSVGTILENYSSDKQFPVYGFGAQLPGGKVNMKMFPTVSL